MHLYTSISTLNCTFLVHHFLLFILSLMASRSWLGQLMSCPVVDNSKRLSRGQHWYGMDADRDVLDGRQIGATWRIRLKHLCVAATRPYVKLLWPHVITSTLSCDENTSVQYMTHTVRYVVQTSHIDRQTLIIVDVWRSVSFLMQRWPSTILHTCQSHHVTSHRLHTCQSHHVTSHRLHACQSHHVMSHRLHTCQSHHNTSHRLHACQSHHVMSHRLHTCQSHRVMSHRLHACQSHRVMSHRLHTCQSHRVMSHRLHACQSHRIMSHRLLTRLGNYYYYYYKTLMFRVALSRTKRCRAT